MCGLINICDPERVSGGNSNNKRKIFNIILKYFFYKRTFCFTLCLLDRASF